MMLMRDPAVAFEEGGVSERKGVDACLCKRLRAGPSAVQSRIR
jgi:hypothetical protein